MELLLIDPNFPYQATISTFDTSAVKQKCRLSLNLAREGRPKPSSMEMAPGSDRTNGSPTTTAIDGYHATDETLHIRSPPEMMYASLGLPVMVKEATKDLPQQLVKDCFSNILITGTFKCQIYI